MKHDPIALLFHSGEGEVSAELQQEIRQEGYSALSRMIDQLKDRIKHFTDEEIDEVQHMIKRASEVFPVPGKISPAWQSIWDELRSMVEGKMKVLRSIPKEKRDGEWQVIMDNPYIHQDVVCYPGLSLMEAAYLYGYFLHDLKRNEYIRLQKIDTLIMDFG